MGDPILKRTVTQDDFLKYLESIPGKAQFIDGEIFDMPGGTETHDLICGNILEFLRKPAREKGCRVYSSGMLVDVPLGDSMLFPDASICCGDGDFSKGRKNILANPCVIFEVISPSSETYDRGGKLLKYRTLQSLKEYIIIAQEEVHIDLFAKQSTGIWTHQAFDNINDTFVIPSLGMQVAIADLYMDVESNA